MFHVILFRPEIPPNTGNSIRLCANTGSTLHLIRPLGFNFEDKHLQRAGMDYAEIAAIHVHDGLDDCLATLPDSRLFAVETSGTRIYSEAAFQQGDAFLFGAESKGLPPEVLARVPSERQLVIPMKPGNRSVNLSNSVAVVVYEAWRQNSFGG